MDDSDSAPPPAPNPYAVAAAQAAASTAAAQETAKLNAIDRFGPSGSATYGKDANGLPTSLTTTLNPTLQHTFDTQSQIGSQLADIGQQRLADTPTNSFNYSSLNPAYDPNNINASALPQYAKGNMPYDPATQGNIPAYIDNVRSAVYGMNAAPLDQRFGVANSRMEQQIRDQGLDPNGIAAQRMRAEAATNQNAAYQQASNASIAASSAAAQAQLGMEQGINAAAYQQNNNDYKNNQADFLQKTNLGNQSRQLATNELLTGRNQNINEIAAILKGSPSIMMPTTPNPANVNIAAPNLEGDVMNAYNAQMQGYQANMANNSANMNGIMGLGSAALGFAMAPATGGLSLALPAMQAGGTSFGGVAPGQSWR